MATETPQTITPKKAKQGRSPAYPFIPVEKALAQAKALHDAEGKYAAPMSSAFKAWGYGEKSSGGRQTLAALRYFGLIDSEGEGETRKVKVSETALRILLDQREDQTERLALIRQVALQPAIHRLLFEKYGDGLPSDATVRHFLVFDQKFNPQAANEIIAEFKATAAFAGLYQPSAVLDKAKIDEGDGDEIVEDQEDSDDPPPPPPNDAKGKARIERTKKVGMKEDVFSLKEGDVVLQWPEHLSPESYEDLEAWTEIILRKIKRNVVTDQGKNEQAAN